MKEVDFAVRFSRYPPFYRVSRNRREANCNEKISLDKSIGGNEKIYKLEVKDEMAAGWR